VDDFDELAHLIMQHSRQETSGTGEKRALAFGHVSSYDPTRHAIRAVLPEYTIWDPITGVDTGQPVVTPWMQLSSPWVGPGWGFQAAPQTGGTATPNPLPPPPPDESLDLATFIPSDPPANSLGTQCVIFVEERMESTCVSVGLLYTETAQAPDPTLQAGEAIFKHASGTSLKFFADGHLVVTGQNGTTMTFDAAGNIEVNLGSGNVFSFNGTGTALPLVNLLVAAFNAHTHPGNNETPTVPWTSSDIASTLVFAQS
jgi:hypothetical protein